MGEAESSAGVAEVKPPCPGLGLGPAPAAMEPGPQASSEDAAAAAAAIASAAMAATSAGPPPPPPPPLLLPLPVVWSPEVEVCLFHAMLGHKPVGVNRHFHMICIRDKFSQNIGRQISSKIIWDHLSTMYDMQALREIIAMWSFPSPMLYCASELQLRADKKIPRKVMIEDDVKEEIKEEMEGHSAAEEVYASLGNLTKATEKPSSKEKERSSSEPGCKEGGDKRKRNRVTEKVLNANSNPSSPSAAKRRRT
ncbi:hypothetical protein Chor_004218 [Crotalus horridus]